MIEIIRQEDAGGGYTPRELPKDIKQIGSPDIGDRIYVEDGVYQALHPYDSLEEKRAYVLLGKFENCSGRQCVFVEAVIPLLEMAFDGELPLWNDHTWAYIYKQLKREYDSMVIVGWAMDIKGQLPNMTVRLENLHQSHFGGAHQLLLLMDSLEREEAFYSNRNGHLYRREGFYIYYDKGRAKARAGVRRAAEQTDEKTHDYKVQSGFAGSISIENGMREESAAEKREELSQSGGMSFEERMRMEEPEKRGNGPHGSGMSFEERMRTDKPEGKEKQALSGRWIGEGEISGEKERERRRESERGEDPSWGKFFKSIGTGTEPRGEYRKRVMEEEEAKRTPSYASTLLLAMVVCALGVTAFLNHEKMEAMEETLAQMRQTQTISTEEATEGTELAGMPEVEVETVAGNVKKQDEAADGADGADASANTGAAGADATNGAEASANAADAAGTTVGAANGSTAAGSVNTAGSTAAGSTATGGEGAADGANAAGGATGSAGTATGGSTAAGGTTTAGSMSGAGSTDTADSASGTGSTDTAATAGETAVTTEAQTYLNQGYYVVQKGDSLVGICRKIYQTTAMMDKLCEVNGIEDEDSIYAGQYLTLPN